MPSKNEHTGAKQQTKVPSEQYKANWDLIFGGDHDVGFPPEAPKPEQK